MFQKMFKTMVTQKKSLISYTSDVFSKSNINLKLKHARNGANKYGG